MKQIFFLIAFTLCFFTMEAQKVYQIWPIKYGREDARSTPRVGENHLWFNTNNGLQAYDREEEAWEDVSTQSSYAEMSISTDTSTISFTNTTALPIEDLTAGPMSGFTRVSDSLLRYDGAETAVFSVNYSAVIGFAEAANLIRGYVDVNGSQATRTAFRQTLTLTTEFETVGGTALVSLAPGALIRFMFFPSTHTGTDVLTIPNFNINFVEVN